MNTKNLLIFSVLILFCNVYHSLSWDTTAAKLYPMAVGNIWSYNYKVFAGPGGCVNLTSEQNYTVAITRDTLMPNGKRYFVFESTYLGTAYRRVDSVKMNIYQYSTSSGNECLYDSLKATTNSTFGGCSTLSTIVSYTTMSIYGENRIVRISRPVPCPGCSKTLVGGIGYYEDYTCLTSGNRMTLNGCIINGILYGQIVGINQLSSEIPHKFELSQNYPNPFNPTTKIKFDISGSSVAQTLLSVYDLLGHEIAILVNQQLQPGSYEADWDATNYTSGVYYYKLETGSFTETKKMVLLK